MIAPKVGRIYWFEYHCNESLESPDAPVWLRSHEKVKVVAIDEPGLGRTMKERLIGGAPRTFKARWDDGFEWIVFEDELLDSPVEYSRPDPPKK